MVSLKSVGATVEFVFSVECVKDHPTFVVLYLSWDHMNVFNQTET